MRKSKRKKKRKRKQEEAKLEKHTKILCCEKTIAIAPANVCM